MTRTHHVRLGLVAVGTLLTLLTTIQPGHSQPGPPGGIRGGPPFRPPTMPGPPGVPQPPAIPHPPNFPQPPVGPRPPGLGGGLGIGGGIGGGVTQWRCGRCGMVLATGPQPPAQIVCPRCLTTNVPPGTPLPPRGGIAPPPGVNPPVSPVPVRPGDGNDQGVPGAGILPPPPAEPGMPGLVNPPPEGAFAPSSDSSSAPPPRAMVLRAILITLGVLLLLAIGIA